MLAKITGNPVLPRAQSHLIKRLISLSPDLIKRLISFSFYD
jgi:hypothetical protein